MDTQDTTQRDIKFRAWHKKRKCLVHFDIKTITKTFYPGYYHTDDLERFDCELDDKMLYSELMQYIGLKDENGLAIYEGDIVEIRHSSDSTVFGKNVGVVKFLDDRCKWYLDTGDWNDWTQLNRKVIGNIFETPNLLPKE